MKNLWEIPLTVKIVYLASTWSQSGWPLVRVLFNDEIVANFEANKNQVEFTVQQDPDPRNVSTLVVEHYGKNYHNDDKFFQVEKIYINNIDFEKILWEGVQHQILPPWDWDDRLNDCDSGNMYLGHNGQIVWNFKNPILLDVRDRLDKQVKPISGQDSTREVLNQVKKFFKL
jgi:hypothetical protein